MSQNTLSEIIYTFHYRSIMMTGALLTVSILAYIAFFKEDVERWKEQTFRDKLRKQNAPWHK